MKHIGPEWIKKFFPGQYSQKEEEKILDWLRTPEGMKYLENHIDRDISQRLKSREKEGKEPADSEKIFKSIQSRIQQKTERRKPKHTFWSYRKNFGGRRDGLFVKLAAAILVIGFMAAGYWWLDHRQTITHTEERTYVEYSTGQEQQKMLTLVDGTIVRLHENSSITIPENYNRNTRNVSLTGEALFDVTENPELPFEIMADEGRVRVLGTQFNVKIDPERRHVQVAVLEGMVALSGNGQKDKSAALLAGGYFGVYNFETRETTIEEARVQNYTSWTSGVLEFEDTPLWKISRQLGWLYGASFRYTDEAIRDLKLYASIPRDELDEVLDIIASTLEIEYRKDGNEVVWMR